MSHEQLVSNANRFPLLPVLRASKFPKWNSAPLARHSSLGARHCIFNRNTLKLESPVTYRKQSPGQFLIAIFRAFSRPSAFQPARHSPPGTRHNRQSGPRKLENRLTRFSSATSKFLIDNFEPLLGLAFSSRSFTLTQEGPLTTCHCLSNRQSDEKLEVALSLLFSTKVPVLIDKKSHFIQGAQSAS